MWFNSCCRQQVCYLAKHTTEMCAPDKVMDALPYGGVWLRVSE